VAHWIRRLYAVEKKGNIIMEQYEMTPGGHP
jgi:hypothetical protein